MEIEKIFNYQNRKVRTVIRENEPWFVVTDLCRVLEIGNTSDAVKKLEKDEVDKIEVTDNLNRKQISYVVNEPGLYTLILRSNKPEAKRFKRWITHNVLPEIRKTGSYSLGVPKTFPEALRLAADQAERIEKQQKVIEFQSSKIERDKPKLDFLQDVFRSRDVITLQETAKAIDLGMGQNRLFRFLREHGILMKNNQPYQKYVDQGHFRMIAEKYSRGNKPAVYMKTVVLPKGLEFIYRKIKEIREDVA
jgi:prophage antirepressor-like protein